MISRLTALMLLLPLSAAHAEDLLSDKLNSALAQTALAQVIGAETFCTMALDQARIEERIHKLELKSKKVAKEAKRYRKYLDMIETADKAVLCTEAIRQAREWGLLK